MDSKERKDVARNVSKTEDSVCNDARKPSPPRNSNDKITSSLQTENKVKKIANNVTSADATKREVIKLVGAPKSSAIDVPLVVGSEMKSGLKSGATVSLGSSSPGFISASPTQPVYISGSPGQSSGFIGSPGSTNFILGAPSPVFVMSDSPGQFNFVSNSPGQVSCMQASPKHPFMSASPSKGGLIFSFDDKQKQLLFDLAVVHECNLDRKFLVDPKHEPPKNLLQVLNDKINAAFWDRLQAQLDESPPVLEEAFRLVSDIKQGLNSILLPWHNRIREEIAEVLDEDLIRQQADNDVFDFKKCALYIIGLMAKLCAPVRDEVIEELKSIEGIVPLFKGIFEVLNLMRIDMINYNLIALRGELLRNGRKYEREKFDQYLKFSGCDLSKTKTWLSKYGPVINDKDKKTVLIRAFLDLICWDEAALSLNIPEPLCHDIHRLLELGEEYFSIILAATIIVISGGCYSGKAPFDDAFKIQLKDNLLVLLKGVNSYTLVERVMPNITEQIVKMVRDKQKANPSFPQDDGRSTLSDLLVNISDIHPVWSLMKERVNDAIITIMTTPKDKIQSLPLNSSLIHMTREIQKFAASFSYIFSHTFYVYGDYFYKFLSHTSDDYSDLEK